MRHERDYIERTIAAVRTHRAGDTANIFADEIEAVWAECERLRSALRAYHDLAPALAECANECGEARLYSDLKQANVGARAALEVVGEQE